MKILLLNADAGGFKDGVTWGQLFKHIPTVGSIAQADCVVIAAVCHHNFRFNHSLNEVLGKKPIIIINYFEYGWQYAHDENNILGNDFCVPCGGMDMGEYGTLNLFVSECNPVLQFHRELRQADMSDWVIPIDFLAPLPKQPLSSKSDYDNRPFQVFNSWGYSHPNRARVHGDIFRAMGVSGINVIDAYDKIGGNNFPPGTRTWLSVFTPHWMRKPMTEVLRYQSQSKISLCLYGAGHKCFRHAEAPENCIMAQQTNGLAWSYPWDESNSIRLHEPDEVGDLLAAVDRPDLYDVYLASQRNLDNYRVENYLPNYVLKNIERIL